MIEALGGTPFGGFLQNTKAQLALLGVGSAFIALGIVFLSISQGPALSTMGNVMVGLGTPLTLSGLISLIYNKCVNQSRSGQIKKRTGEQKSGWCLIPPWGGNKLGSGNRPGKDTNLNITPQNNVVQTPKEKQKAKIRSNKEEKAREKLQEKYTKHVRDNPPPPPPTNPPPSTKSAKIQTNKKENKLGGEPVNKKDVSTQRANKLENKDNNKDLSKITPAPCDRGGRRGERGGRRGGGRGVVVRRMTN